MSSKFRVVSAVSAALVVALGATACMPGTDPAPTGSSAGTGDSSPNTTVKVVVHDSFQISDELVAQFETSSGYDLQIVTNGDGGALVNKLILTKDAPLGDVAYGVDNTFASRALNEGVFADYVSANEGEKAAELRLPGDESLTAIDFGDVCLNEDLNYFSAVDLSEPLDKDGFFNPAHADKLVVTNPATSTPGLSFLLATIGHFGEDGYLDYWRELVDNGVKIVDGWEDAYYVDFTGTGEGDRPVVLSYASSPAFTVPEGEDLSTTAALLNTCFRQVEYAGVLSGAANPEGAQAFIDFLLTTDYQDTIADAMYMYPVTEGAYLPESWENFAPIPEETVWLDPALIDQKREQWIKEWSAEILG